MSATNWNEIFERAGLEMVTEFAAGRINAHTFRNTSMEARRLLERAGSANRARYLARQACRRRAISVSAS